MPKDCFVGLSAYLTENSLNLSQSCQTGGSDVTGCHSTLSVTLLRHPVAYVVMQSLQMLENVAHYIFPPKTLYFIQLLHVQRKIIKSLQSKDFQHYSYK